MIMRSMYVVHFAFVCIACLGLPGALATSSLRRTSKAAPEGLDPDLAEAEALASQAEAEALGGAGDASNSDTIVSGDALTSQDQNIEVPDGDAKPDAAATADEAVQEALSPTVAPAVVRSSAAASVKSGVSISSGSSDGGPTYFIADQPRPHPHPHWSAQSSKAAKKQNSVDSSAPTHLLADKPREHWTAQSSKAAKKHESVISAGLRGGPMEHWGAAVRTAVKSLAGNATKEASASKPKLPRYASAQGKTNMKEKTSGDMDHHHAVRTAVRAAVKEALPDPKRTRKVMRQAGKLPERVTRRVGQVAYGAVPSTRAQKKSAPAGLRPEDEGVDIAMARTSGDQDNQDFSQVEPGLAYGQGQPHSEVVDQNALKEADRIEEKEEQMRQARELKEEAALGQHSSSEERDSKAKQRRMLHEVEELEEQITEETKSPSLSYMLGGVKMDLYQLNEKVDMLHKDVEDGVLMDPGHIDEGTVYPLSACMRCIFLLSAQYFIIYTAFSLCKGFVDVLGLGPDTKAEKALRAGCDTVSHAPMLCVLFLGAQLRATQITLGQKGPQGWAETAMQVCAWSCLIQTLMVLAIPMFSRSKSGRPDQENDDIGGFEGFLSLIRYAALMGVYAGFTMVCVAVVLMDARSVGTKPADIWDDPKTARTEYAPPVSVAMICTITLTLFFFIVHLVHAALWSCKELVGRPTTSSESGAGWLIASWEVCFRSCTSVVNMAPMLCILFIAARMRALQMDPKWGRPQNWAEACFYICVGSIVAQTLLIIIANMVGARNVTSASMQEQSPQQDRSSPLRKLVLGLSYLVMGVTYVACGAVLCSVFLIKAKDGVATPPLSPTMKCVMFLVVAYLVVHLCLFLTQAAAEDYIQGELSPREPKYQRMLATCKMAENTVKFGPMLAVLFVGARMRALQMSDQQGSPQCWAQDAMYMASGALIFQLFMVVASGALSSTIEVDDTGALDATKVTYLPGRMFLECMKIITFIMLFGGIFCVVGSILVIRPETAHCAARGFTGKFGA